MNTLTVLLLSSFVALAAAATPKWKTCYAEGKKPAVTPTSVELTPLAAAPGEHITFVIKGENTYGTITEGDFKVSVVDHLCVHYRIFTRCKDLPVYKESKSICDRADCPIEKGPVEFSYIKALPSHTPGGEYIIGIQAWTGDTLLVCMQVWFTVESSSATADELYQVA